MSARPADWPDRLFETLKHGGIRQVAYVPTPATRASSIDAAPTATSVMLPSRRKRRA